MLGIIEKAKLFDTDAPAVADKRPKDSRGVKLGLLRQRFLSKTERAASCPFSLSLSLSLVLGELQII